MNEAWTFHPDKDGPLIALVVAVARNGVIGRDGALPWKISDDLKWFRRITTGKPVIMGRRTWDSIGKPLPERENIVVSRRAPEAGVEARWTQSLDAAFAEARAACAETGAIEACVIGGAEIYAATLARADRIYLTMVEAAPEGDAFMPPLDRTDWRATLIGESKAGPRNEHDCSFLVLDRRG